MLTKLRLVNFKSYINKDISIAPLTVLAGLNSAGKSTIIQSILLLRQSYEHDSSMKTLMLNGRYTQLGSYRDVHSRSVGEDDARVGIGIMDSAANRMRVWSYQLDRFRNMETSEASVLSAARGNAAHAIGNVFDDSFEFIGADRMGPSVIQQQSFENTRERGQLGVRGEYCYDYLRVHGDDEIDDIKRHEGARDLTLAELTDAWMGEISPGVSISSKSIEYTQNILPRIVTHGVDSDSPLNVGFGISYTLPIVIALLKAKQGSLVILENPEAHIHPRGQRQLGELIARTVAAGAQVIVETHSDHVLNGIRLAVKGGLLKPKQVGLTFVEKHLAPVPRKGASKDQWDLDKAWQSVITEVHVQPDGSLDQWPDGFFDEWNSALRELLRR